MANLRAMLSANIHILQTVSHFHKYFCQKTSREKYSRVKRKKEQNDPSEMEMDFIFV
jgi:hypothetical protein